MIFFRKEIRQALEHAYDLEISEASTESEFILKMNSCGSLGYDLIILDLNLPDGNGLSAMRKLKKRGRFSDQKFIVVSFDINRAIIPLLKQSGAGGAIIKPVSALELVNKINSIYPGLLIPWDPAEKRGDLLAKVIGSEIRNTNKMDSSFNDEVIVFFVLAGVAPPDEQQGQKRKETVRSLAQAVRPFIGINAQVIDISVSICLMIILGSSASDLPLRLDELCSGLIKNGLIASDMDLVSQAVIYPDQGIDPAGLASKLNSSFNEAYAGRFLLPLSGDSKPEEQGGQQEDISDKSNAEREAPDQ